MLYEVKSPSIHWFLPFIETVHQYHLNLRFMLQFG